jgi:hypothetical protein
MSEARAPSRAPWIAAAVAGVVLAALLLVFFVVLEPDRGDVVGGLDTDEKAAVSAASTEAANVLSYRRAHFDQDFQRALDGATGAIKSDLRSQRANTLQTITKGKFDLSARVDRAALEGRPDKPAHDAYLVLVSLQGYQSSAPGIAIPSYLEVTVEKISGKWLVSDIRNIGITP